MKRVDKNGDIGKSQKVMKTVLEKNQEIEEVAG